MLFPLPRGLVPFLPPPYPSDCGWNVTSLVCPSLIPRIPTVGPVLFLPLMTQQRTALTDSSVLEGLVSRVDQKTLSVSSQGNRPPAELLPHAWGTQIGKINLVYHPNTSLS